MERTAELIEARMTRSFNDINIFDAPRPQPPSGSPAGIKIYSSVFKRLDNPDKDPKPAAKKMRFTPVLGRT